MLGESITSCPMARRTWGSPTDRPSLVAAPYAAAHAICPPGGGRASITASCTRLPARSPIIGPALRLMFYEDLPYALCYSLARRLSALGDGSPRSMGEVGRGRTVGLSPLAREHAAHR